MQNCKGFLHPAVFEGFGIPPLEALSLGAPIALARASCLPELYGDTARYFDPYDYDVDLDALFAKPAAPPDKVMAKYSWEKTARPCRIGRYLLRRGTCGAPTLCTDVTCIKLYNPPRCIP